MIIVLGLCAILLHRCFQLQIVNGEAYLEQFILMTEKTRDLRSSRGNIYDRNGNLLAYNELAYSVKMEDVFESGRTKNKQMNETIYRLIQMVEKHGDHMITDFKIIVNDDGQFDGVSQEPAEQFLPHLHLTARHDAAVDTILYDVDF